MLILQGVGPWKREPPIFPQFCFVRGLEKKSSNNMRYQIGKTTIHDDIHIYIPIINIYLQNWINKPYHPIKTIQGAPFFVLSKTRFCSNQNNQRLLQLRISFQAKKPCWAQHPTWSKRSLQQYLFLRWLAQCSASWGCAPKTEAKAMDPFVCPIGRGWFISTILWPWGDFRPSILGILGVVLILRVNGINVDTIDCRGILHRLTVWFVVYVIVVIPFFYKVETTTSSSSSCLPRHFNLLLVRSHRSHPMFGQKTTKIWSSTCYSVLPSHLQNPAKKPPTKRPIRTPRKLGKNILT